jgi:hypothetical protein
MSLLLHMGIHPLHEGRGVEIEIRFITPTYEGRAHFIDYPTVESIVVQCGKECLVIDLPFVDERGPYLVGFHPCIVDQVGNI